MGLPSTLLPCSRCSAPVCELTQPELPADLRGFLSPVLKLASLKTGERIEMPKDGDLFKLVSPVALSRLFALKCMDCADDARAERLQHPNGNAE